MPESREDRKEYIAIVAKGLIALAVIIVLTFALAGRIDYWQGWAFAAVNLLGVSVSMMAFTGDVDLARERTRPGPGTKWWDWIFWSLYLPAFMSVLAIGCLDGGRYHWTSSLPWFGYAVGYGLYLTSLVLYQWAMRTNRFFSSTVRIQSDRGQTVVQTGPYRFARHPGYVGGIMMAFGMSITLGSLWGLVPAGVVAALLIVRTLLEDRTLKRELEGYAEYAQKVRFRLLPGIW